MGTSLGPRRKGRKLKVLLVVLAILVVVVAVAPTLIAKLARGRIEAAAREALQADVSIGDLSLGWLSGLDVQNVVVEPKVVGKPGISIGSITAKPQLSSLFRGRVEVPDLLVKHVTLNITKPEKPLPEEPEEPEEPESAPPKTVPGFALRATIEDVTIVYRASAWDRPLRVDHLGPVTIAATSDDATHVEIATGPSVRGTIDAHWTKDGKKLRRRERSVSGELTFDHADLSWFQAAAAPWLDKLAGVADGKIRFQTSGSAVETSGNLQLTGASAWMRGRSEPHRLEALGLKHDLKTDSAGESVTGRVEVAGSKVSLAALSTMGEALRVEKLELKAGLSGNIQAEIETLVVQGDFADVKATGRFAAGKEPRTANVDLEAKAAVDKLARWLGGMPEVSGALTSKVKVALAADGTLEVRGGTTLAGFAAKDVPGVGAVREKEIVVKHDLDWGGETIRMRDVSVSASFLKASCTGSLEPGSGGGASKGQVNLELDANLDVIAGLFGEHLPVKPTGKVSVTGRLSAEQGHSEFHLGLKGNKVVLSGGPLLAPLDLGDLQVRGSGVMAFDRSVVSVVPLTVSSRVAEISCAFEGTGLTQPHPAITVGLNGTFDVDRILPAVSATKLKAPVGQLSVTAKATSTRAEWDVDVSKLATPALSGTAHLTLPHSDVPAGAASFQASFKGALEKITPLFTEPQPGKKPLAGEATVTAKGSYSSATSRIELQELNATGPGLVLTGKAQVQTGAEAKFDLDAKLDMAEAAPVLQVVSPGLQGSGTGTLRTAGRLALAANAKPEESQASFDLKLDRLKTEMLDLQNLAVEGALEGGVARTKKATAQLNGGTARLDATVDFRPALAEWKANVKVDRVQVTKEMQPAIARAVPIFSGIGVTLSGVAGCALDVAGRGETWEDAKPTLTGTGMLSLAGARLANSEVLAVVGQFIGLPRELQFDDFQTQFRVENGAVRQDRLVLTSQQVDLVMSGTTSFEGRLDYVVGAKPKGGISNTWQKLRPVLDKEGFLAMRLQGDVRHPSLKPPKIENLLGGAVEDALKGGIEDLFKKKKKPN